MYIPKYYSVTDVAEITRFVESIRLGTLVTYGEDGFFGTSLPWLLNGDLQTGATLTGHVARANPHWQKIADGADALVIFSGPDAYVSPNWYPSKTEHGRVVPTWAYQAVHVEGKVQVFEDPPSLEALVRALSSVMEHSRPKPWTLEDAPRDYIDKMLGAIIGVRMVVTKVEAKYKLDQKMAPQDAAGAASGLAREGTASAQAVAEAMRKEAIRNFDK